LKGNKEVKRTISGEQAIRDNQMNMEKPFLGVFAGSLARHRCSKKAFRKANHGAQMLVKEDHFLGMATRAKPAPR
jgi:hypothetical protein